MARGSSDAGWLTDWLVPDVAAILIREKLGKSVKFVATANTAAMLSGLSDERIDVALNIWPNSVAALTSSTSPDESTVSAGTLGFFARSGWFVPASTIDNASGAFAWSMVNHLYSPEAQARLLPAKDLPVLNRCEADRAAGLASTEQYGGYHDCADGSWVLHNSSCCPRAEEVRGACAGRPSCLALVVENPLYDPGLNQRKIAALSQSIETAGTAPPGLQIVYGNASSALEHAERVGRPLLLYSWTPRANAIDDPMRFLRITMRDAMCGRALSNAVAPPVGAPPERHFGRRSGTVRTTTCGRTRGR